MNNNLTLLTKYSGCTEEYWPQVWAVQLEYSEFHTKMAESQHVLVMQCFQVVHYGISHESLVFSWYTHESLGECVYEENTSDKWDIP